MKNLTVVILALISLSAFAEECSSIVKLKQIPRTEYLGATLENGLVAPAFNDSDKLIIQTAYITDSKLCYDTVAEKLVAGLSIKR